MHSLTDRRISRRTFAIGAAAAGLSLSAPALLRAQEIRWIGASNSAPSDSTAQALDFFVRRLGELTSGQIAADLHHGNTLGDDRDHIEGILQGSLQIAAPGAPILSGWYKPADVFTYPYLFKDVDHKDRAMTALIGEFSEKMRAEVPLRILGAIPRMGRHVTSNKIIVTPDDMKGLKIRTPQTPMWVRAFERFGASPTPLPFPDVFSSLQTGVIDGQENPLATIYQNSLFTVNKHLSLTEHMFADNVVVIGETTFSALSAAQQEALAQAARDMEDEFRPKVKASDAELLEQIRAQEVEVTQPDKEAFAATVADLHQEFPHTTEWVERARQIA